MDMDAHCRSLDDCAYFCLYLPLRMLRCNADTVFTYKFSFRGAIIRLIFILLKEMNWKFMFIRILIFII